MSAPVHALARVRYVVAGLPRLLRIGLVILAVGLAVDVALHLFVGVHPQGAGPHEHELGTGASLVHALVFVGMAVSLAGVCSSAIRRSPANQGRGSS